MATAIKPAATRTAFTFCSELSLTTPIPHEKMLLCEEENNEHPDDEAQAKMTEENADTDAEARIHMPVPVIDSSTRPSSVNHGSIVNHQDLQVND